MNVLVTLKSSSTGKKLYLFPSAEALYVWSCAIERKEHVQVDGIEEIVMEPGSFIEAELLGFEYSYESGQKFKRFNLIRLGHAQHPQNASGLLVTIHAGWVMGGMLPMRSYSDSDIEVRVLQSGEGKLELPTLFDDASSEVDDVVELSDEDVEDADE